MMSIKNLRVTMVVLKQQITSYSKKYGSKIFQISVYPVKNNKWGFHSKEFSVGKFKDDNNNDIMVTIQSVSKVFSLERHLK